MIQITRGSTQYHYLELSQNKPTSDTPVYWLFKFTNQMSNVSSYCIVQSLNTTAQKERYDKVQIQEKTTPTASSGEIELKYEGFYDVVVYQQTSATNTNTSDASVKGIVIKCLAYAKDSTNEISYTQYDNTETNTIYITPTS